MNIRKLYYSRKRGKIIIEGVVTKYGKKNTIHIWTLPDPLKLIKSCNLPREKMEKIMEKINRVDHRDKQLKKRA